MTSFKAALTRNLSSNSKSSTTGGQAIPVKANRHSLRKQISQISQWSKNSDGEHGIVSTDHHSNVGASVERFSIERQLSQITHGSVLPNYDAISMEADIHPVERSHSISCAHPFPRIAVTAAERCSLCSFRRCRNFSPLRISVRTEQNKELLKSQGSISNQSFTLDLPSTSPQKAETVGRQLSQMSHGSNSSKQSFSNNYLVERQISACGKQSLLVNHNSIPSIWGNQLSAEVEGIKEENPHVWLHVLNVVYNHCCLSYFDIDE